MIPSRRLFTLYVMTAHLSLTFAFLATAWDPHGVAGFFYHSRMVAIVHLVTIGWIAMSILGNLYVVVPMAFSQPIAGRPADYVAYALVLIGLIGMVAHFWISEFGGMAWSAATAASGVIYVAARSVLAIRRAKVNGGVKLHIYFASANALGAVTAGVLLGFDKVHSFLPGYVLANVFAHAHLAAIGWAGMMVVGIGYRLLPMMLGAATPAGWTLYLSASLLEAGVVGLFVLLVARSNAVVVPALLIVAGFVGFGAHVIRMLEGPHRPPRCSYSDAAAIHLVAAAVSLLFAVVCGVMLAVLPVSESTLRLALLYGTLGLVGFLAQTILGFEHHILAIAAGCWKVTDDLAPRFRLVSPVLWLIGVPAVASGLFRNAPTLLGFGAWLLFVAAFVDAVKTASRLTIFRRRPARTIHRRRSPRREAR